MKCVIPGVGIRAFGKAVHCLAKIGEDLYLETSIDRLYLKTVNPSRSGYVCFEFDKSFFHTYSSGSRSNEDVFSCKIMAKSFLSVFRALSSLEKSVDHCKMSIDQESFKVVLIFHCKHGIVKTHKLGYEDCDTLKAVYTKETCPNKLTGISRTLSEVVVNFPNSLDEVTLIAKTDKVQLKNYVEDSDDANRVPLTEVMLFSDEFEDLVIQVETSITFCLKELRAVLSFSDSVGDSLSISFETPGKPVILSIDNNPHYNADIVLATLVESTENGQSVNNEHTTKTTQSINTTKSHMTTKRDNYWNHSTTNGRDISMSYNISKVTTEPVRSGNHDLKTNEQHNSMKEVDGSRGESGWVSGEDVPVVSSINRLSQDQETQLERTGSVQPNLMDSLFVTDERELNVERLSQHVISGNKGKGPVGKSYIPKGKNSLTDHDFFANFPHQDKFINKSQIPVTPISQTSEEPVHTLLPLPAQLQDDDITTQDSVMDSSGFVPSTPPPAKKFKSLFASHDIFGGSEGRDSILAPDSEDED